MPPMSSEVLELARDFPGELIGLNDFAELVGFDASTTAQVRAERTRNVTGFPAVVSESGRTFLHRIDDLVNWLAQSRYTAFVSVREDRIAAWRLERRVLDIVEQHGVTPARHFLAAAAIAGDLVDWSSTDPLDALRSLDDSLIRRLFADVTVDLALARSLATELTRSATTATVVDQVLVAVGSHQPGVPHRTPDGLASLVAVVLDAGPGDSVHEPTAGECEVLLRVARLAQLRNTPLTGLSGDDRDPASSLIGRARLRLAAVDAEVGAKVASGSIDRMVIDTGTAPSRRDLAQWLRLLHRNGRVVVIAPLTDGETPWLTDLPPRAIIFPPQRSRKTKPATALWVSTPFAEAAKTCIVVDLRGPGHVDGSSGISSLAESLQLKQSVAELVDEPDWQTLGDLVPPSPVVAAIASDQVSARLGDAINGTLEFSRAVVADNQAYAAVLAQELDRLLGGPSRLGDTQQITPPPESPSGILASQVTDEARRVIARLATSLSTEHPAEAS